MTVTAPPRPPRPSDPVDHGELEALVEALIEEARQRARRRRRRYGASILLVALVAGVRVLRLRSQRRGRDRLRSRTTAGSSGGAASAAVTAGGRWGPSMGRTAVTHTLSRRRRAPRKSSTWAPREASSRAGTADAAGERRPRCSKRADLSDDPRVTSLAVDPRAPATVYAARSSRRWRIDSQELFKSTNGGRSWRALDSRARLVAVSPADPADRLRDHRGPVGEAEPAFQEHERRP